MTVEFWIEQEFDRTHERGAMVKFFEAMQAQFGGHPELYLVLANFYLGGNQIDYTVLKRNAVIVIDMKEYTDPIRATENGPWRTIPDEHPLPGVNPFQQVSGYRRNWIGYLNEHQDKFLPPGKGKSMNLEHVSACIAVSPKLHPHSSNEIPPKARWFKLVGLDELTGVIDQIANPTLNFTDDELRTLVSKVMNLRRWWTQPLSTPVPSPYNPLFSPFPVPHGFVDRQGECTTLEQRLVDKSAVVMNLRGPGGIGKTELAAWFVERAFNEGYRIKWVDCREHKDVSLDRLIEAVACEVQSIDPPKASFMRTPQANIEDRRAAAFSYLDEIPTFLVWNDYDAIADPASLDEFHTYVVHHANNLRILLTTRKPLECLDNPAWPPCAACEIKLGGLPLEVIADVLGPKNTAKLTASKCEEIWRQTSGNPYLMRMIAGVMSSTDSQPGAHALDDRYLKQWFGSVLETLSDQARPLAFALSVIRIKLNRELVRSVSGLDDARADQLRQELVEQFILRENGGARDDIAMYDLIREFLLATITPKAKRGAHNAAGKYFGRLAAEEKDEQRRVDYMLEALYHFVQAPHHDQVLQLSDEAYASFIKRGFWNDARRIAANALAAARAKEKRDQIRYWLLESAKTRIGCGEFSEVASLLEEAEKCLPRAEKKPTPKQLAESHRLRIPILIQRGRLKYHQGEKHYEAAREYFKEALGLAQEIGNSPAEADCLVRIGQVERRLGRYTEAQNCFLRAYEIAQGLHERRMEFECVIHLGKIARDQSRFNEAYEQYLRAYAIAQELKDQLAEEMTLSEAGRLAAQSGKLPSAKSLLEKSLKIAGDMGNTKGIRIEMTRLIDVLVSLKDYSKAEDLLRASEKLHQKADDEIGNAWNLKCRGQLKRAQGHTEQGNELIRQGIQKLVDMGLGNMAWIDEFKRALEN